jgi:3D (Asp-Asp-Asp) domain-containing protein
MNRTKIVIIAIILLIIVVVQRIEISRQNRTIKGYKEVLEKYTKNPNYPLKFMGFTSVSAYTSRKIETDSTPFVTSSGYKLEEKDKYKVAASNQFPIGQELYIEGIGWVKVLDKMHRRFETGIDIWFGLGDKESVKLAKKFGVKVLPVWSR